LSGDSVILTASPAYQFLWNTGETTRSIVVKYGGTYTVSVSRGRCYSVSSDPVVVTAGCITNAANIVTLNGVVPTGATIKCPGDPVTLAGPVGPFNYLWNTGATTRTMSVTQPGTYYLDLSSSTCSSIRSTDVQVWYSAPAPTPTIVVTGSLTLCAGDQVTLSGPTGYGFLWNTGQTSQSITVSTPGSYSLTLYSGVCTSAVSAPAVVTLSSTCSQAIAASDNSATKEAAIVSSLAGSEDSKLILYPNPTKGEFRIQGLKTVTEVVLYSVEGREINRTTAGPDDAIRFDGLHPGFYIIKVEGKTLRLVVE
jgi:hypothetical protein